MVRKCVFFTQCYTLLVAKNYTAFLSFFGWIEIIFCSYGISGINKKLVKDSYINSWSKYTRNPSCNRQDILPLQRQCLLPRFSITNTCCFFRSENEWSSRYPKIYVNKSNHISRWYTIYSWANKVGELMKSMACLRLAHRDHRCNKITIAMHTFPGTLSCPYGSHNRLYQWQWLNEAGFALVNFSTSGGRIPRHDLDIRTLFHRLIRNIFWRLGSAWHH